MVLENFCDSHSTASYAEVEEKLQRKTFRGRSLQGNSATKGADSSKGAAPKQQGATTGAEKGNGAWGDLYQNREHFTNMHCF